MLFGRAAGGGRRRAMPNPKRQRRPLTIGSLIGLALASSAGVGSYTVRPGDSLSVVAKRLGTTVVALAKANGIVDPDRVKVGQVLKLSPAAAPTSKGEPAPSTYVIKEGDSLSVVAKRLGLSVDALAKANKIVNLDRITLGQSLVIPGAPPTSPPPTATATTKTPVAALALKSIVSVKVVAGGSHQGTDMLAARGTPVVANLGGTLEPRQGRVGGIAYYLHADDGNTYYGAHLDALTAAAGRIEAGQQIGVVGDTGDAKGGVTH